MCGILVNAYAMINVLNVQIEPTLSARLQPEKKIRKDMVSSYFYSSHVN